MVLLLFIGISGQAPAAPPKTIKRVGDLARRSSSVPGASSFLPGPARLPCAARELQRTCRSPAAACAAPGHWLSSADTRPPRTSMVVRTRRCLCPGCRHRLRRLSARPAACGRSRNRHGPRASAQASPSIRAVRGDDLEINLPATRARETRGERNVYY